MKLEKFELERIQSEWEHVVEINLSESGVEPFRLIDLIVDEELQQWILQSKLGYPQTNGSIPLREVISGLYRGADPENITVTNGGAEANLVAIWWFIQKNKGRDEMVMQLPNYMQIWGLGNFFGFRVKTFWLKDTGSEWTPDLEGLKQAVSKRTCLIAICNPNNPTGAVMTSEQLKTIAEIAEDAGAWILSDEVYQGSELDGKTNPTMFDFYDQVLITNSLSKAYGLPGLRIGWVACQDKDVISDLWAHTDYTTIAPSTLSDVLATIALKPDNRMKILDRTRNILRKNWVIVSKWLQEHSGLFECNSPKASAICLTKYNSTMDSVKLAYHLIREKNVLIAPGDYFQMPNTIRIGYGHNSEKLTKGLHSIAEYIQAKS